MNMRLSENPLAAPLKGMGSLDTLLAAMRPMIDDAMCLCSWTSLGVVVDKGDLGGS